MANNENLKVIPEIPENHKRAVGVFKDHGDVESLLTSLKENDFDMNRVSLIARNLDEVEGAKEVTEKEGNEAKEGAASGATTGTVLGGIGGFLVGVGLLTIPGVGPILAAGAEISAIASTLAGAGIGAAAGGIIGALVGLGIPEEKAKVYNERVKAGYYLVMITASPDKINQVESMMQNRHVEDFEIFDAKPTTDTTMTTPETTDRVDRTQRVETSDVPITESKKVRSDHDADVVIVDTTKTTPETKNRVDKTRK